MKTTLSARLAKAGAAFGRLSKRLWDDHGIRLETKIAVYRAVVLISLLYGCEPWTLHRRHIAKLDQFHLRCLRKIAHIKWMAGHGPNTDVLDRCQLSGIGAHIMRAQLRWTGHVIRMEDTRIPKQTFYGQLSNGTRNVGRQYKRFKDHLKNTLLACNIPPKELESLALERDARRASCGGAITEFEMIRINHLRNSANYIHNRSQR